MNQYVHVYNKADRLFSIGYYHAGSVSGVTEFRVIRDCATSEEAAAFISYLNGGNGAAFPDWEA
jgi:hypothetical protein